MCCQIIVPSWYCESGDFVISNGIANTDSNTRKVYHKASTKHGSSGAPLMWSDNGVIRVGGLHTGLAGATNVGLMVVPGMMPDSTRLMPGAGDAGPANAGGDVAPESGVVQQSVDLSGRYTRGEYEQIRGANIVKGVPFPTDDQGVRLKERASSPSIQLL